MKSIHKNTHIFVVLLLILPVVIAFDPPPRPIDYRGIAYIDGSIAPDGTTVSVISSDGTVMNTKTLEYSNGYFNNLMITWDDPDTSQDEGITYDTSTNEAVRFKINNNFVNLPSSTSVSSNDQGSTFEVELYFVTPTPAPPGPGGGRGGGICPERWSCGTWTECSPKGIKTRTCTESSTCGTTKIKPLEVQECIPEKEIPEGYEVIVDIPPTHKVLFAGDELIAVVTISGIGSFPVSITYKIISPKDEIIREISDDIQIIGALSFDKRFNIPVTADLGEYQIQVEIEYDGKTDVSSDNFKVIRPIRAVQEQARKVAAAVTGFVITPQKIIPFILLLALILLFTLLPGALAENRLIHNITKNTIMALQAKLHKTMMGKTKGLMFAPKAKALIFQFKKEKIIPLHMVFVFFSIDVLYLNKSKKVVEIVEHFKPFRFYTPKHKAMYIVELPAKTLEKAPTHLGDKFEFHPPEHINKLLKRVPKPKVPKHLKRVKPKVKRTTRIRKFLDELRFG